ncbi:hypothetical protein QYM36_016631 [Artemia franciscana]|uniref:Uncharacterized protein n=1 Tax=Artemia franciscana TaxID=6661 RepID=A0AA88H6E2_ARTSF|nr:hypothetical protein QYM36_016631 [Artemia franciscana]
MILRSDLLIFVLFSLVAFCSSADDPEYVPYSSKIAQQSGTGGLHPVPVSGPASIASLSPSSCLIGRTKVFLDEGGESVILRSAKTTGKCRFDLKKLHWFEASL